MFSFLFVVLVSACASLPSETVRSPLAAVQRVDGTAQVVLEAKAADRIGIQTAPIERLGTGDEARTVIPYSALIYDTKGDTFAYTNSAPLTYLRHRVRIETIQGDRVVLAEGPPAGAAVVVVGASQLLGIELGVGS